MAESMASRNQRVNDYTSEITAVSLHSADPGTTGASEIAGGSPAYARKAPTFAAAANGAADLINGGITFDVASGATIGFYGLWNGATFYGGGTLSSPETFGGQGTYNLTSIPITT